MRRGVLAACVAAVALGAGAQAAQAGGMDMYSATVERGRVAGLLAAGYDVTAQRDAGDRVRVELVLTRAQRARLAREGVEARLIRVRGGRTVKQEAAAQAAGGYEVWRSWDEPGGLRDEMRALAHANPQLLKLVSLGRTHNDREILALKLTQAARAVPDGSRPAVLHSSVQHAREWIAAEVNRRLLHWYIDRWRANDREVKDLLKRTELWFVLVANPDGYQHSFDVERLWRKNLRDNDGDGRVSGADGVDPNRNWDSHFDHDREGSSSDVSSQTYRGPAAESEPETRALAGLIESVRPAFHINYHSYGEWLLYPRGWQIGTPAADDPIFYALSGNRDRPAIDGYHPGVAADVLYVTNGETTDYAGDHGTLAWTPELSEGCPGCGFVFPDDEDLVQSEFERNLLFARSVAASAPRPADPVSGLGIRTKPFYVRSDDPYKDGLPGANFTFPYSYGDPQPVQVLARRSLGAVTLRWRVNGGEPRSAGTVEWSGGEAYGQEGAAHYRIMRGAVTGTDPGDSVEVWFEGGGERSESFTYEAVSESGRRVLVVAAEDYTGASPVQGPGPHHADAYLDALAANGVAADVYDIDALGRRAPDSLGVLGHYDAVVWYTGDDVITRDVGWGPGNASRLAMDQLLEARAYMNEGGRVLYTGKYAGHQHTGVHGTQRYDPLGGPRPCSDPAVAPRCLPLRGSGDGVNDVLQYWFGAYLLNDDAGADPATGTLHDVVGVAEPFAGLGWSFGGADSAGNQDHSASFITTSGVLPPAQYPQFRSWASAQYDRPGGPFEPHTGEHYVYSQLADVSYKRLSRTVEVPAGGGELSFWTSYDTESHWDHLLVEARTAGGDDWTTLPDVNGHTSQDTGDSCPSGWHELHPHLAHYQTRQADGTCAPTGTSGAWHAASGSSGGWQEWRVDLSAYAGRTVELAIAYVSDWSVQGLGAFVDDVTLPDGTHTSFEDGLDGWAVSGPPPGSSPNSSDWTRTDAAGFPEGAAVTTPRSILLGFGLEGISGAGTRADVLGAAMRHLLR